jgi:acetylornithine deacetylase/succinyl-diaminopimelate desuccinylase-like protein
MDVVARGLPGHGSVDRPGAAPDRLILALARLSATTNEVRVVPAVAHMFRALAPLAPLSDRDHYLNLRGALALRPEFRERFLADPGRAALVRNTAVVTTLHAGRIVNVVPAEARATIDARLLPGDSCADFAARTRAALGSDVELQVRLAFDAAESPTESALLTAISKVASRHEPRGFATPRVIAGFTDAHWFRELGIASYGFVPRRLRAQETRGVHGPNERISLDNLTLAVETLLEILDELDR